MLASSLGLGCAITSFVFRRHEKDRFQTPVVLGMLIVAIAVGRAMGASANLILLGWIPWALDVAMVLSVVSHSAFGWTAPSRGRKGNYSEKTIT